MFYITLVTPEFLRVFCALKPCLPKWLWTYKSNSKTSPKDID